MLGDNKVTALILRKKAEQILKKKPPVPISQFSEIESQKLYQELGFSASCPEAENASSEVLSLPVHPSLEDSDLEKIVSVLKEASNSIGLS